MLAATPARSATAPASPVCVPGRTSPPAGLTLVSAAPDKGHPRVDELTFRSRALNGTVRADVMLPVGYDPHGATRYPVLYLLHGHGGNHVDWPSHGVDKVVGNLPVIVVMPDGGYDGWYSDWYGTDADGHTPASAPGWETFHFRELLPWVDATYRTIADRPGRAVAGLSMGGFAKAPPAAHVAHTTNLYGGGTHSWPYWVDDLRAFLPRMQAAFAHPPAAPPAVPFAYESAASQFSVWGWTFTAHRDEAEMTYL